MANDEGMSKRRVFYWSSQATDLVEQYKQRLSSGVYHGRAAHRVLVARLAQVSGNPREACLRWLRNCGIEQNRSYREWTKPEQRRLLDLITIMPVGETAKALGRPEGSVRSMLHRLGVGGRTGREWFTKYSLSRALHTRPDEIQKWIDRGWLKSRTIPFAGVEAKLIDADDFCQFVKEHGQAAVSRRLTYDALWFVQNYVFPPSHAELLSVRGPYTKRSKKTEAIEGNPADSETEP